jgi:3-carboxy-cis,cis-muconate cycloisomerase
MFGDPETDAELTDVPLLRAMLDVERELAWAGADLGVLPRAAAAAIAAQCSADRYDIGGLARAADAAGNPVVPLVRALAGAVPEHAKPWVHHGATSQDVLDTAFVLVAVRATGPVLARLEVAADACAGLADQHRGSVMAARTLGQQAGPTTFGLKAAGWLMGLLRARARLAAARSALPVQLGGAAGTLAALGSAGPAVSARLADRLGLVPSPLPWHTDRQPLLELATGLGGLLAATGKVAVDVGLLAQTEVGEVAEAGAGRGGSSALPHKRNPVDSVLVTAIARRGPGLVGTLFAAAVQEHERAAGGWHAEWEPRLELLRLAGGAAARTGRMLYGLEVRPDRMRANLAATGGLVMAEAVAARLAPALGRTAAHDAVARAAARAAGEPEPDFAAALLADPAVRGRLPAAEITDALIPSNWLGAAGSFVDRAIEAYGQRPLLDHLDHLDHLD